MINETLLIADIGGTNARFALVTTEQPYFVQAQTFQCADYEQVEQAIDAYLGAHQISELSGICFAVAGPIIDGNVQFTNNQWRLETNSLRHRYSTDNIHLFNDFAAIAYSLPTMRPEDVISVGGDWPLVSTEDFNLAVIGPGSGLGIAGLIQRDGHQYPVITEGGHSGFAAETELQADVLNVLSKKFERVSIERLLSGPGLMNIHEALYQLQDEENPGLSAADIAMLGTRGGDSVCQQTMDLFFEILGQVAGDVGLITGAWQGVFIAGGITQRYPDNLVSSKFRSGFENKGRYASLMQQVPTWLIKRKNPGLVGCSIYANRHMLKT